MQPFILPSTAATRGAAIGLLFYLSIAPGERLSAQVQPSAVAPAPAVVRDKPRAAKRPRLKTYMGRTIAPFMDASGAEWLTRLEREQEEQPAKLMAALPINVGDDVCDFGCGNGYYTLQLANRVGPAGKVYAVDIQQEMLDKLVERMGARALSNVEPVLASESDPKLPANALDLLLMVDVYHELSRPVEVLASVRAAMRAGGRMVLVEFREEDPSVPIKPLHKMSQVQVIREITANRFKLVGQYDDMPWQHVLMFARDDSPLAEHKLQAWRAPTKPKRENPDPAAGPESSF